MFIQAALFLVQAIFDVYIYIVLLRLMLQTIHMDYFNPLAQFSIRLTQWIVRPLQKIIPEFKRIDLAILALLLMLEMIKITALIGISAHTFPDFLGLVMLSAVNLANKLLNFYFYAIIMRVILSWVSQVHHNPLFFALHQLTEPVLRPLRHLLPMLGGLDISPLLALILTQLISLLLMAPLSRLALMWL